MVDKHEEITLPIVLSCNYQSDITYPGQKQFDCGNPVIDKFVRATRIAKEKWVMSPTY